MNTPTDGLPGRVWRTVAFPVRAVAPFWSLAGRAVRGDYWMENTESKADAGPELRLADRHDTQGPDDGAGPLNHRRYRIWIADSDMEPEQLLELFRSDPNAFCPTSYAVFVPDPAPDGLTEGSELDVKLPGPWDGPVYVHEVLPDRIRLNTRVGHMEAGWIEFRAVKSGDVTEFTIESYARSGDSFFDTLYHRVGVGKAVQTQMWVTVIEAAAEMSGGRQQGRVDIETIIYTGADQ